MVDHYSTLIRRFLEVDGVMNAGRAAAAWPLIIGMVYPVLAEKPLEVMLLVLVMRSIRNQEDNVLAHLDFVEIFSGAGWLTFGMVKAGYRGAAFDVDYNDGHNCLSSRGLRLVFAAMSCIKKRGMLWLGTPCSSFTVLCRHQSQRHEENSFMGIGPDAFGFVHTGNYLMEISALCYFVSYLTSVWVTLEQPLNSCMPSCGSMRAVLYYCNSVRYLTYMGAFQGQSQKPLQLLSTWPAVSCLTRNRPTDMSVSAEGELVVRSESGFTGQKQNLKLSQMYTRQFGEAVAGMCQEAWQ